MRVIGLTGGIGSGKSTVSMLLATCGIPVYIADKHAKQLTDTSDEIRAQLTELLGTSLYESGRLNRKLLASRIFSDSELLNRVNAIIHPQVYHHFITWKQLQPSTTVAIESAILFESNFDRLTDATLMVYAPLELRIRRVMIRDGVSETNVLQRIGHQLSDEVKKSRADYTICNDDRQPLIPQIEHFLTTIEALTDKNVTSP